MRINLKKISSMTAAWMAAAVLLLYVPAGTARAESGDPEIPETEITDELEFETEDTVQPGLAHDLVYHRANEDSPVQCDHNLCFWNMKMGLLDESAIWYVMTQPITVLEGSERKQCMVRARPDINCEEYTGCVTYASQGVHVLERGDEWTLIEAYSTCFESSSVEVYDTLIQGYVETSLLKEVPVDQTYGILIDKQQQRLYVFKEGRLLTTMLCSTGFYDPKKKNPWNETPAGEFLMVSWTGQLKDKEDDGRIKYTCDYAIRINDEILIHEVPQKPYYDDAGNITKWSFRRYENVLGEKASHGCIRVQRKKTPEGINAEWLWRNLSNGTRKGQAFTKVLIWDDHGRYIGYPDDGLPLYYNAKRDKGHYHSSPDCSQIKGSSKTVTFTYGELEDSAYKKLAACPYCAPQLRKKDIDILNEKNDR